MITNTIVCLFGDDAQHGRPIAAQCTGHISSKLGCPFSCECAYLEGMLKPHYPVPAIIYGFNESWDCWEYIGQPDDVRSSYPTYYKRTGWPNG